jgi:hypothetical protein
MSGLLERHKSRRLGIELSGVVEGGVKGGPRRNYTHTATLSEKNLCLLPPKINAALERATDNIG